MKFTKGISFLLSGIIALIASRLIGENSELYGFLIGYGFTATVGGIAVILIAFVRNYRWRKQRASDANL